jgi:hypothetical protein
MTTKKTGAKKRVARRARKGTGVDVPSLFRINVHTSIQPPSPDFSASRDVASR